MATSPEHDPGTRYAPGNWESLHHVAKSTPCIDRSGFSAAEISGSAEGTGGESSPSSRYSKREHFSHSPEPGQQLHHYLRHASTWERLQAMTVLSMLWWLVYGGGNTSEVDAYNPPTNTWTKIAPLPWAGETSAVSDHGLIYAISDVDSGSVAAYHPQTNIWSAVASLPTARSNFAATVDSDGTIYVMGGSGAHGVTNEVDTYNPATNSWTTVAPLPEPAAYITAAPGNNGVVYIIGDDTGNGTVTGATYAYNPGYQHVESSR